MKRTNVMLSDEVMLEMITKPYEEWTIARPENFLKLLKEREKSEPKNEDKK